MEGFLKLYNTLSRQVEVVASVPGNFGVYCCGPTVYNYAHIGNFRTFAAVDLLVRVLDCAGYRPFFVRNITDIDDKTISGARTTGQSLATFTGKWTKIFREDCRALNLVEPSVEPCATAHLDEQIDLIGLLLEKKFAYVRSGSVYFRVSSWKSYGLLSRLSERELLMGDGNGAEKENAGDFVLWKASKESDGEVRYGSPWGEGRPGWHIECSAMAMKYLGNNFPIHAGGIDLCFPHHENEIAQTEAATGQNLAKLWFHVAHLRIGGEKMSKSIGNLYNLNDIREMGYSPETLRYALLSGHYRQPLNFAVGSLRASSRALGRLRQHGLRLVENAGEMPAMAEKFEIFSPLWEALLDDLHVPKALGLLFSHLQKATAGGYTASDARKELSEWLRLMKVFGFSYPVEKFSMQVTTPEEIVAIAEARKRLREDRDFAGADALREKLLGLGWSIQDGSGGYELARLSD
ncbi:MAG: cysteine--tRNA ligase [Puniceicoccales bacterium]|nr:cysteine--tRNA ligase [Puniceicoccales bacterium]